MLQSGFMQRLRATKPVLNPRLCEGLAHHQSQTYEGYIDAVMRAASSAWPEAIKYIGARRATPLEQLAEACRVKRRKRNFEVARSDLYLMVYELELHGEKLKPRFMLLPYIRRGSLMRIRAATYQISPVAADNILTVGLDKIYMPVTRSKLYFHKVHVRFKANGKLVSMDTVHSLVYNVDKNTRNTKRHSLLVHYILCKAGLIGGLKRYLGIDVVVGHAEINETTYPTDKWVICESTGIAPKGMRDYYPSTLRIALRKEDATTTKLSIIGGIFYIADHEPALVLAEESENIAMWRRLLPRFIMKTVDSEKKAAEKMEQHFESLNHYMDELVKQRLQREGIACDDIYDVFADMLTTFEARTSFASPANLGDKHLETTRFVLYDLVATIFQTTFALAKLSGERLNKKKVEQTLDGKFRSDAIERLYKAHGEVESVSTPTDLMVTSTTRNLVLQHRTTTRSGSKNAEMSDRAYALHASQGPVCGFGQITKSQPSGRGSINHFLPLSERDEVVILPEFTKELEDLEKSIGVE